MRGGPETFYSRATKNKPKLSSPAASEYHVYGAWWKDAKKVTFYADAQEYETVYFRTDKKPDPFNKSMYLAMVTETYDWEKVDNPGWLNDNSRNATYYDWVRSWKLVPVNQQAAQAYSTAGIQPTPAVLNESVDVVAADATIGSGDYGFDYEFKSNGDQYISVEVSDEGGNLAMSSSLPAYTGHGFAEVKVPLEFSPQSGTTYTITVSMGAHSDAIVVVGN